MLRPRKDSHKDFLRSQAVIQKRKRKLLILRLVRLFLAFLVLGALIYLAWLPQLAISRVVVVGTDSGMASEIEASANSSLDGAYLGIIPKRNALFYPKQSIESGMLASHPSIRSASLKTEGFNSLSVKVTERQPFMRWCAEAGCFLMDDQAFVYATDTDDGSNALNLLTIYGGPLAASSSPVGGTAFDPDVYKSMSYVSDSLASSSMIVDSIDYKDADTINFKIQDNGILVLSGKKSPDDSIGNFKAALKSSVFSTSTQFEYIDARFGNKVFYRTK